MPPGIRQSRYKMKTDQILQCIFRKGRFSMSIKVTFLALALALTLEPMAVPNIAVAQSLDVKTPSPLHDGINRGTVDSFIGAHFWAFTAQPGNFKVTWTGSNPSEGFSVNSRAHVEAAFGPNKPGCKITARPISSGGMLFEGSVTTPSRVVVMVEPANSPLVRQTVDYQLNVTNASGGTGGGAEINVVGNYNAKINPPGGFAKFLADGTVVCSSGEKGTWELFDADTRAYVISVAGARYNVIFQPGRGFIDGTNNNLLFEAKAPVR